MNPMEVPTYVLVDTYEGDRVVVAANIRTADAAYRTAYKWIEYTDGECCLTFYPRYAAVNPSLEKDISRQLYQAFYDYFGEND